MNLTCICLILATVYCRYCRPSRIVPPRGVSSEGETPRYESIRGFTSEIHCWKRLASMEIRVLLNLFSIDLSKCNYFGSWPCLYIFIFYPTVYGLRPCSHILIGSGMQSGDVLGPYYDSGATEVFFH